MRGANILLGILLVAATAAAQGCVLVAVGAGAAGTVAYIKGDLESVESAKIDKVYDAVLKATGELQLAVIQKGKDAMTAKVIARDAEDKKIIISLAATAEGATKMTIRVGWFGSENKSRRIYDQAKKHL